MNQQQRYMYLSAMGITVWQQRDKNNSLPSHSHNTAIPLEETLENADTIQALAADLVATPTPAKPTTTIPTLKAQNTTVKTPETIDYTTLDWSNLRSTISSCQQCPLAKTRNQAIVGTGSHHASLMIIGDAPADDEDRQNLPFAGKTGQLLTNMLHAIDIQPQEVYLTNLIKCRPPNNRTPYKNELKQCDGFIQQQIKLINPDLILVVGRVAAQRLLMSTQSLAQLRHKKHTLSPNAIPIITSYHPAYLLRQTSAKVKTWQDLKQVQRQLALLNKQQKGKNPENASTAP